MAQRTREVTGVDLTATSDALQCQAGNCAIQIYDSTTPALEVWLSLDGTNYVPARDPAGDADIAITADGIYGIQLPTAASVKVHRSSGTYSIFMKQD